MTNFFHLIIVDASGSMHCIRRQALSGCNETIQTIRSLQDDIKRIKRENPDAKTEALVTIITDGEENCSSIFNQNKIRSLVEECKQQDWTFAFIGANIDEVMTADRLGIHNTLRFEQDNEGTAKCFR